MFLSYTIDDGKYGPKMVLHGPWNDSLIAVMKEHGVKELYLNHIKGWQGEDLEFLRKITFLEAFKLLDRNFLDLSGIHYLSGLKSLHIDTYCQSEIDFSCFKSLDDCALSWRPKAKSIASCTTLQKLFISNFKENNFNLLSRLINLEELRIKVGSLDSLNGISELSNMKHLKLYVLRRLSSLAGIEKMASLTDLMINSCFKIKDYQILGNLHQLKSLSLDNDGPIDSIKFILNLKYLESFYFIESTNILDGDMNPILAHGLIKKTGFQNRRHYSHKCENIRIEIEKREGLPPGTLTGWPGGKRISIKQMVDDIMRMNGLY